MRLLRRSGSTAATAPAEPVEGSTTGKGRPTPKRQRAVPPPPPPTTRKEAYARLREKSREQRTKAQVGMAAGDDRYILPRDRGPARRLARDIVDGRRNAGSYVFAVAIIIVLATAGGSPTVRLVASYIWLAIILALVVDSYLLSRIIRRVLAERLPAETRLRGHYFYAIMRAATFRRMRSPRPQVKVGSRV